MNADLSPQAPDRLAEIHAAAFPSPWSAATLQGLLQQRGIAVVAEADGFVLFRVVADEAEIRTVAVRPSARRQGIGARLMAAAAGEAASAGAGRLILEVGTSNHAARALYGGLGMVEVGRRPGYYAREGAPAEDALILSINLPAPLPSRGS
jgi:ribosomal-protein-alanine N-acetyltransferase